MRYLQTKLAGLRIQFVAANYTTFSANSLSKFGSLRRETQTAMPVFSTEYRFYEWRSEYLFSLTQAAQPDVSTGIANPVALIPAGVLRLSASVACSTSTAPLSALHNKKEKSHENQIN